VKNDTDALCVRIPNLGVTDWAVVVIGQSGQSYGLLAFSNYEEYDHYLELAAANAAGQRVTADVRFLSLNYEHARDLETPLISEVKRHNWKVAGPTAYPWPIAVEENWATRPPTARELTILDALSQALPHFIKDSRRFHSASLTRVRYLAKFEANTPQGPLQIEIEFPHPAETGDDAA
jgi:hypothetical protein